MKQNLLLTALATALLGVTNVNATPLGTGFTYQGKLGDNGQPANGTYDFVFVLYNSPTNDLPIYSGVLNDNVAVTNGLFTTTVDFGADLFQGEQLWLEVGVRSGDETGDFTPIPPRQALTATPFAHFARRAAVADTATTVSNVNWSAVKNLPPSLADGVDNDTTYSAGTGLALSANNQFSVNFAGNGSASTVAKSDHNHVGQTWIGTINNAPVLRVQNTSNQGIGFWGKNDEYGSGFSPFFGAGVFGDSSTDPGVAGFSNTGPGVYGWISALSGIYDAVKGENPSTTGRAVAGYATATSGANIGVLGQTDSSGGTGIRGYATATTGTTYGGRFSNVSPGGYAIHGVSDKSGVAYFDIDNRNNGATALEVRTDGTGMAAKFTSGSSSNGIAAVQAVHLGHGDGLAATAGGQGNAGNFKLLSDYTNNAAVLATGFGKARGLKATSVTGEAIRAESSGTAIYAKSEPDGTALAIDGGAIRVKGAGVGSSTAVFVHRCTSANTTPSPTGNPYTTINHPMCNDNPNAILFITPRIAWSKVTGLNTYEDLAVTYTNGRWMITNTSLLDEIGDFDEGDLFNVMVILP